MVMVLSVHINQPLSIHFPIFVIYVRSTSPRCICKLREHAHHGEPEKWEDTARWGGRGGGTSGSTYSNELTLKKDKSLDVAKVLPQTSIASAKHIFHRASVLSGTKTTQTYCRPIVNYSSYSNTELLHTLCYFLQKTIQRPAVDTTRVLLLPTLWRLFTPFAKCASGS